MANHPVIVIAPDKSCIDDKGFIKPSTEVILISDPEMYARMEAVLSAWGKEKMGVPGKRREIEG